VCGGLLAVFVVFVVVIVVAMLVVLVMRPTLALRERGFSGGLADW
jgi:hypothetical protein